MSKEPQLKSNRADAIKSLLQEEYVELQRQAYAQVAKCNLAYEQCHAAYSLLQNQRERLDSLTQLLRHYGVEPGQDFEVPGPDIDAGENYDPARTFHV